VFAKAEAIYRRSFGLHRLTIRTDRVSGGMRLSGGPPSRHALCISN
jgi:hypothetical protein